MLLGEAKVAARGVRVGAVAGAIELLEGPGRMEADLVVHADLFAAIAIGPH
jgi:hypothetical protein